jgi:hypothetical protein
MVLLIVGASYPGSSAHQATGENTTVDENLPSEIRIEPKTLTFERESSATTQGAGSSGSDALNKLIHFKRGTIHPGQTSSSDKIGINNDARLNQFNQLATKRKHVLVQFKRLLLPKDIRFFEQNGIIILRYIPNYSYLIGISEITNKVVYWNGPGFPMSSISNHSRYQKMNSHLLHVFLTKQSCSMLVIMTM